MTEMGIHKKLERLSDDAVWFASALELRVHFVYAESDISEAVLRTILRGSRVVDRPTPYLTFLEPFCGEGAGWPERIRTLADARASLAEELALRGTTLRQFDAGAHDIGGFATRLLDLAAKVASACAPPVVVLAPTTIDSPARWNQEVELLVMRAELASIRWVLVVPDENHGTGLACRLGESALTTDCRSSPEEGLAALQALLRNTEGAPADAASLAIVGMAWPRVAPPPRRTPAGVPVPACVRSREELARLAARTELMRAGLAMAKGAGPESIRHLRTASEALRAAGLAQESLTVWLMMATTLATAGDRKLACGELDVVVTEATRCGRLDVAAQAASAKASLLAASRETTAALQAYGTAITAARSAGPDAVPLLIEVLRAAGQLCLEVREEARGIACFREALAVADAAPPSASAGAAEVARALAALCRKRGLRVQAESLEAQGANLERAALAPVDVESMAEPA
jgi:hypothetical protein